MHLREPGALPATGRRAGYTLSRTRPTASSATTWEGSPSIPANVIWYQWSPGGATYPMFQPSVVTPPSPAGLREQLVVRDIRAKLRGPMLTETERHGESGGVRPPSIIDLEHFYRVWLVGNGRGQSPSWSANFQRHTA